ncbi:MAG: hypothetical protein AAGU02_07050, partial [Lawsonibacter sp.]
MDLRLISAAVWFYTLHFDREDRLKMKKIVSFFATPSDAFDQLNRQAAEYAESLGFSYRWAPQ